MPSAKAAAAATVDMVDVPAGTSFEGCNEQVDTECKADEKPGREVSVGAFKIDRTEVTVEQFGRCVDAGACSSAGLNLPFWAGKEVPSFAEYCNWGRAERGNYPINCVDWQQANAYCTWAGKRLPTQEEWEKAARGTDGRKYPWGNEGYAGMKKGVANIADETAKRKNPGWPAAQGYDDGQVDTAPVGSYPAGNSPYGAQGLCPRETTPSPPAEGC